MEDFTQYVLFGIAIISVLLVFGLILWRRKRNERLRREALAQKALPLRLTFSAEGDPLLLDELKAFQTLGRGWRHRVRNLMRGERQGVEVEVVDFGYSTGAGKHQRNHEQTLVCCRMPAQIAEFYLRPEIMLDKIGTLVGHHDIDFEHRPSFSQRFFLRGPNEAAIRSLFSERVLAFLENQTEKLSLAARGDMLVVYIAHRQVKAEHLEAFLDKALSLAAAFRA